MDHFEDVFIMRIFQLAMLVHQRVDFLFGWLFFLCCLCKVLTRRALMVPSFEKLQETS